MKNYDKITLDELYEDIRHGNFNWDYLFESGMGSDSVLLWESVKKISSGATNSGIVDQYEISLSNGQIFFVFLNFLNPKKTNDTIINNTLANNKHDTPTEAFELYNKYFSDLGPNDKMCYISFKDFRGRQHTTGEVGLAAKGLFSGLKAAMLDSLWGDSQNHINLKAVCIKAYGEDKSRVSLFEKLMSRYLSDTFPNVIMDYKSDTPYVSIMAVK
jgi:hypothetical protein